MFLYEGPDKSRKDAIRFLIGDTKADKAILTDEEINWIIDQFPSSEVKQLQLVYRQCANHYNSKANKRSLGPQMEDTTERAKYFSKMADKYDKLSMFNGTPPLPEYSSDKVFDKGMMANEET